MRMTPALRTLFERYRRRAGTLATKDFLKLRCPPRCRSSFLKGLGIPRAQSTAAYRCNQRGLGCRPRLSVAPLDLLPDLLPAVGFIDDFAVIAFAVNAVREEIEHFRLWRGRKTRASADAESHAATTAP